MSTKEMHHFVNRQYSINNFGCVYGYARRTPDGQKANEMPIEDQERRMRKWAELKGSKIMGMYIDVATPETNLFERPRFIELLKDIDKSDVLLVIDIPGISSDDSDIIHLVHKLKKMGANLICMREGYDTFTEMGDAMIQTTAIMKKYEKFREAEFEKECRQYDEL